MLRRLASNLALMIAAIAVGVGLFEGVLRVVGFSRPSFYRPDHHTGAAHRPGASGWDRREGEVYVEINSHGLRDREHHVEKAPGTYRIAILGDSFAEGLAVEVEDTFWSEMERRLADCPRYESRLVQAVNFGVSGYGTAQSLLTLRHRVWPWQPDLVIYAMFTENDVRDNSRALSKDPLRPYFVLEDGGLTLDNRFRQHKLHKFRTSLLGRTVYALIGRLRVLQLANHAKNEWRRARLRGAMGGGAPAPAPADDDGPVDDPLYGSSSNAAWTQAWAVTDALLATMARETRAQGVPLVVVTLSNPIQVHPDRRHRAKFMQRRQLTDLFEPERRVQAVGKEAGFDVLPLAPQLQAEVDETKAWLHGFARTERGVGHWNPTGHQLAGQLIAQHLCATGTSTSGDVGSRGPM